MSSTITKQDYNWSYEQKMLTLSKSDSTCFFCIEPCNYVGIEAATRTSAQLKASQCVGRAGTSAANDVSKI